MKSTHDMYFKTSASSNEGFKSHCHSTNEPLSFLSPKESQNTERTDTTGSIRMNLIENSSSPQIISIMGTNFDKKDSLLNNIKLLYDQNTDRSKKRTEQIKKMRNSKSSIIQQFDQTVENINEETHVKLVSINPSTLNIVTTDNSPTKSKVTFEAEENNINNDDAEVMISDLDCSVEEKSDKSDNLFSLSNSHSTKSFVPITNCLKTKNAIKEDNATPSYLLALSQYEDNNPEEEPIECEKINFAEHYDSLEKSETVEEKPKAIIKEVKHIRLPSGKNYLINSIIEEEINETYTDSEISLKKRSYLFTKSKYGSSEKKLSVRNSKDAIIDKNLENTFFNKIKALSIQVEPDSINMSSAPSKFDISEKKKSSNRKFSHKIAKSEIFNLQIDLKKTLDELSKKKLEEDEQVKSKVENKKKELIDLFFHKSTDNTSNSNSLLNNINLKNNIKKIVLNIPQNENDINAINTLGLKKSPSGQTREKYYQNPDSSDKSKKVKKLEETELSKLSKLSKDEFEMKFSSPIKNEISGGINIEDPIMTFTETSSQKIPPSSNYNAIKEKYKKERRKSSIFKSEDLRVSKVDGNNLYITPIIQNNINLNSNLILSKMIKDNTQNSYIDQSSYININNNINICSPISVNSIKNDIIEYSITNEKKVTDKTLINPFDNLKNTFNNDTSSQKKHCINLNLTISNNKNDDSGNLIIKRKLFENIDNSVKVENLPINKEPVVKKYADMAIASEINIDIKPEVKKKPERNRRISMEMIKCNSKINFQNTQKHTKTSSVNVNVLNDYKKNTNSVLSNINTDFNKKANLVDFSKYRNHLLANLNKVRSSSNSSIKFTNNTDINIPTNNNSFYTNTSPFNKISERTVKTKNSTKMKISPSSGFRQLTPSITKSKKTSSITELKQLIRLDSNKKEKSSDKNLQNIPVKSNVNVTNAIPKLPKKKPASYRTNSEMSFSNLMVPKYSNKLKIFEAMRYLNYAKINNQEIYKLALEKLARSKGSNFVLLIAVDKKGFVFNYI